MAGLKLTTFVAYLEHEWRNLTTINASDRPWQMPLAAALSVGLPLMAGALFHHLDYGTIASLGGLVFLYLPNTPLRHRMGVLLGCGIGMTACYAVGVIAAFMPMLKVPILGIVAIGVTMAVRFYRLGPPGPLFFIMAASIAAYSPVAADDLPIKLGVLALGCGLAGLIAFAYSLLILSWREAAPVPPRSAAQFGFVVFEPAVIGVFVGASLGLAQAMQLDRPYWVPVSCLAVIQGLSLRAIWTRQIHRILGTMLGLLLVRLLLTLPIGPWSIALTIMALSFIVENAIVRHYGFAVIFITPLAILLAEAPSLGHVPPDVLITARLIDTIIGCTIGFLGGYCLHNPRVRHTIERPLRSVLRVPPPG